jgi:ribose transport system substrate-binding protein
MTSTAPRRACIALLTAAATAALAACSTGGGGSSPAAAASSAAGAPAAANAVTANGTAANGNVTIAYVPGVSPFPYFDTAYRGGAAEAKKYGYTLKYIGVSAYDPSTQAAALNAELAARPSFLLVSPDDDVALRPAIQRYIDAGIPVITVGGTLKDTQGLVSQIATDNAQGGQLAADYLGRAVGGKGTIAVLNLTPGSSTVEDRVTGFEQEMREKYPQVTVLPEQYGGGTTPGNEQAMRSLLLAHPGINGVFGVAETSAEGAAAAIAATGKTGQVKVAAFDASPEEVKELKSGLIDFLSASEPGTQLALAVDQAHDYLTGERSAIKAMTLVANIGVTTGNVGDPAVTPFLYASGS